MKFKDLSQAFVHIGYLINECSHIKIALPSNLYIQKDMGYDCYKITIEKISSDEYIDDNGKKWKKVVEQ